MSLPVIIGGLVVKGGVDLLGDAIEGAGSAVGGIAKGIGAAVGGIAQGAGAALGGALQGALTDPDVVINNFGMAGSAGKSKIKTTVAMNFNPASAEKLDYSEQMPLEKLMVVAIKYLSSISKSIKNQGDQEAKLSRKQSLLDKENAIEASPVQQMDTISGKKKDKSSNIAGLLKGMGAAAAALAAAYVLDTSSLDDLTKNFDLFKKKYAWLFEHADAIGLGLTLLSFAPIRKVVWQIVKTGGAAAGRAGSAGVAAAGGASVVTAALAFGGAAAVTIWAPFDMNSKGKEGIKQAKNVGEKLKQFGIDTKTTKTPGFLGTGFGSFGTNEYTRDGKKLSGAEKQMADEYAAAYSGARGASSVADLDKKYAKATQSKASGGKITDLQTAVYNAFRSAGFSHQGALSLAAEVGRENSFREDLIFGTHIDPANGAVNAGIFSYQKDRATALMNMLQSQGLIQGGRIERSQKSLNAMASFARQEMDKRGNKAPNGQPLSQYLSGENVNAEDAARGLGKGYIVWKMDDPKYAASGNKNRREAYASTAAKVGGGGDMSGVGEYSSPGGGAMEAAGALVAESFDAVIDAVKKIGSTDTTFKANLTAATPKFNKTDKLIEDSVKFQNEIDLGKKADIKQNQTIRGSTSSALRRMNDGVLDVIDPNYKMDKNSILTSYIMNFKESMA